MRRRNLDIARSTIYDWINPKSPRYDPTFPKQRRLGIPFFFAAIKSQRDAYDCLSSTKKHADTLSG
ncbi:AlpA family phage regulatory protein [Klebsiella aerogenes]|uniref:AlpA family phage regulatory protein n=1 Tax=Klebsiella aerogenes TaxID=548 RepID=UPI0039FBD458